ncbi:hypothetical protein CANINC_000801 [Pichia inconspicua]|uniref:Karyogamy protein n=1 Tax=Pichia inconspicua TaxID=52247 RepID=A0A4T0X596_9ASCO|nr:hypothetical protein CANINC_000801 [[Candida] inconspicua]
MKIARSKFFDDKNFPNLEFCKQRNYKEDISPPPALSLTFLTDQWNMTRRNSEIGETIKSSFDIEMFESSIKIDFILNSLKDVNFDDSTYITTNKSLLKILENLNDLKLHLIEIAETGTRNKYEISWLMSGKDELVKMFSIIDLLEFNMNTLLNELDRHEAIKTASILDTLTMICNHNLSIKATAYPLRMRLSIINHFNELKDEVLASVHDELIRCIEKLDGLDKNVDILRLPDTIKDYTLKRLIDKKHEIESLSGRLVLNGFVLFSEEDIEIYSAYTDLHEGLSPIAQSLKIIPTALNDFFHTSKPYYKSLIKKCILMYDNIMRLYRKYTDNLRKFKSEYILERNDLICEVIFHEIDITADQPKEILEHIISILKPLDQNFCLSGEYQKLLKDVEYKLNCIQLEENVFKTPLPKSNGNPVCRRSFSNPLTDTLNMKPVLSISSSKSDQEFKIFHTPKLFDQGVFSNENNEIIRRIKMEVDFERENDFNGNTPSSDRSFSSSSSSPETMRVKNIFDSPDPFVTPNSQKFQRSRLPVSTPLTTPRITPTKKYVMLPIDEEPRVINDWNSKNLAPQKPLLRYELSTVIKEEHVTEEDTSNSSSDDSPEEILVTPGDIDEPGIYRSPPISKIPLPLRPESRMNLLRSASRLEVERGCQDTNIVRPDSRLANMATSISSKLGTPSPAMNTKVSSVSMLKSRSSSVLTHREINSRKNRSLIDRLPQRQYGLNIVKSRGISALASRSNSNGSRITTL